MRVLVSAYACEPGKGSEPEVGWQWVRQIARFHETWVMTRTNNQLPIENELKVEANPNLHFIYLDLPTWAMFWKRGNRGIQFYYQLWQILSGIKGRRLHKTINFDIAQHVTFVNDWIGSGISLVPVPLVWGPIGSHPFVVRKHLDFIGLRDYLNGLFRLFLRLSARYRDPLYLLCNFRSRRVLVANQECIRRLPWSARKKAQVWAQNAETSDDLGQPRPHSLPMQILSVGRLAGLKGFRLSIRAFAKHLVVNPDSILTIVGAGKQRNELELLVKALRLQNKVLFTGQLPRKNVLDLMTQSHAFLFPSFEGAGMVVIEAMAKGLPVVCLDFGGPGEYVTEECGIKVPLTKPEEVVQGLADALSRLASDPDLYESLSAGTIERVRNHYTWDRVGDRLNTLYQEVYQEAKRGSGHQYEC